jgi:hypothetical protein
LKHWNVTHEQKPSLAPTFWNLYLVIFLIGIGLLAAYISWFWRNGIGFSPDGATYLEQTRNLLAGVGPLSTPWGLENLDSPLHLSNLWPPGFALSMAALSSLTGISVETAGGLLQLGALALLPLVVFFAGRRAVGDVRAAVVGVLAGTSNAVLSSASMILTDVYSFALVVVAVALLLNGRSIVEGLFSGLLMGAAYAVRNAHMALLLSVFTWLVLSQVLGPPETRFRRQFVLALVAGVAAVLVPLLMWNVKHFGALQPYSMSPSTVSMAENVRDLIAAFLTDVISSSKWSATAVRTGPLLALWPAMLLFLGGVTIMRWRDWNPATRAAVMFSWIYLIFGMAMLLIARSRWEWGERINERHTFQYSIFLWLVLASLTLPAKERWKRWGGMAFVTALAAGICAHGYSVYRLTAPLIGVEREAPFAGLMAIGGPYLCGQPSDLILVSNLAVVFRGKCDARVRHPPFSPNVGVNVVNEIEMVHKRVTDRPTVVAIFKDPTSATSEPPPLSARAVDQIVSNGWKVVKNDFQGVVVRR